MFALDEDMPFVCDDGDVNIDDGEDDDGNKTERNQNMEYDKFKATASTLKTHTRVGAFACSDRILNPPVLHLFSKEHLDTTMSACNDNTNVNVKDETQQQQQLLYDNDGKDNEARAGTTEQEYQQGPRSLIQEFKKFQLAFDAEEL